MKILFGLGNPGEKYAGTRHNMGFRTIDRLSEKYGIPVNQGLHRGIAGCGMIEGEKCWLVKPLTFMNNSGECVRAFTDYYKVLPEDIIIIYDDIDLDPGQLRIRKQGTAGSHNGMKSVISHLGTTEFLRIRVGVGAKPEGWDLADYVLARLSPEEETVIGEGISHAADAAGLLVQGRIGDAMSIYNAKIVK